MSARPATAVEGQSAMAVNANGTTIVVWAEKDTTTGIWRLKAKLYAFDGTVLKDTFFIPSPADTYNGGSTNPAITVESDGSFKLVLEAKNSQGNLSTGIFTLDISAAGDLPNGTPPGRLVKASDTGNQVNPEIVNIAVNSNKFVVWQGRGEDSQDILFRAYTSDGRTIGNEIKLNLTAGTQGVLESFRSAREMDCVDASGGAFNLRNAEVAVGVVS
jgi:hypothetical protein